MARDPNEVLQTPKIRLIDPEAALVDLLGLHVRYERAREPHDLMIAALNYATETMLPALGEMAFLAARNVGLGTEEGDRLHPLPSEKINEVNLLLTRDGEPGGHLLSMEFQPVLTPEGEKRMAELAAERDGEIRSLKLDDKAGFLAMLGIGPKLRSQEKIEAYKKSGEGYRRAEAGDKVTSLLSIALDFGSRPVTLMGEGWSLSGLAGHPKALENTDVSPYKDLLVGKDGKIDRIDLSKKWWQGQDMKITASLNDRDRPVMGRTNMTGPRSDITMVAISRLMNENGLTPLVNSANDEMGEKHWFLTGVLPYDHITIAGCAAVHASGGLFDEKVSETLRSFSREIAAQDVSKSLDEWLSTARRLVEQGFTSRKKSFTCNDMDDHAFADIKDRQVLLGVENQNQVSMITIILGDDDAPLSVSMRSRKGRPVGRFLMVDGALRPDYDSEPGIEDTMRNVRDMNGLVNTMASISCVFAEEYPEEDDYGPQA